MKTPLATIYTNAIHLPLEEKPKEEVGNKELMTDLKLKWINSTISQEHKKALETEISELLIVSVKLTVSFPSHQNHHQIIQNLNKVDCLQKVLDYYAK